MPTTKIEQRTFSGVQIRTASGSDFALVGVAASYDMPSAPIPGGPRGNFTERIQKGAFTRALREKQDVKALFNHSANYVLGRVKNGTLVLTDTAEGLAFRCQLARNIQMHQDIYASVQSGLIDSCSFAFFAKSETWSSDYSQRTLTDVDLFDVSVVTNPAYPGKATKVDARYNVQQPDWRARALAVLAKLEPEMAKYAAELRAEAAADEAQSRTRLDFASEAVADMWKD